MLVFQGHREHRCYIAYPSFMEAEEFQAPAVLLSYFTTVTVTVHVTEFSDVQVSNSVFSELAIEAGAAVWL